MINKRNIEKPMPVAGDPAGGEHARRQKISVFLVFHSTVCCSVSLTQKSPYDSFKKVARSREGPSQWLLTRPKHSRKRTDTSAREKSAEPSSSMSWLLHMNRAT